MNPAVQPAPLQPSAPHKGTPCFLIENHDEAYYLWRDAGVKGATLVHVDPHHDMWPTKGGPITVGSFIYRAMMEGIVSDIYWVVPDATFASPANVDLLLRNLEKLSHLHEVRVSEDRIMGIYGGHRLEVCTSRGLPALGTEVLLDVDVDYFVLPMVSAPETAEIPHRTPWAWPEDLAQWLQQIATPKMITVAYSVNGGTTPIPWKYLGEEVRARLSSCGEDLRYFELIRQAETSPTTPERFLREAISLRPEHPAAHWHLAEMLESAERLADAQQSYQHAMACDDSYASVYASAGPCLEAAGRWDDAESEYKRLLCVDPKNVHAMFGLASVAAAKGEWALAREFLIIAIADGLDLIDGHRLLGDACAALNDKVAALSAYEKYCVAIQRGERSMETPLASREQLDDLHEVRVRARMAALYRETGNAKRAEEEYWWLRSKVIPNTSMFSVRCTHATLLWDRGQGAEAIAAISSALLAVPSDCMRAARKVGRGLAGITSPETPVLNVVLNVTRSAVAFLCAFATSIILARKLGPQAMGIYGYTLWVAGVMVALCHFGLPTALSKFLAERLGNGDRAGAAEVTGKILALQFGIVLAVMATGSVVLATTGASTDFPWIFAVLLVLPLAMQQSFSAGLRGTHQYGKLALVGVVSSIVQLLLVWAAAWSDGSVQSFLAAMVVSNVIAAAFYWQSLSSATATLRTISSHTKVHRRALFRFIGPVAYLVILDAVVWQRSETYFLKNYALWQEIGFYSIAYLIVSKLNDGLVAVTSTLMPLQSSRLAASGMEAVAEVQWKSLRALQVFLIPACAMTAIWAKPLIAMFYGAAYLRVVPVLLTLLVSPIAISSTDVSVASLYALDRQRSMVVPLTFTAILNLVLAFLLVPRWGAIGAATANSAAQFAEGMFLLLFSASVLALKAPWRRLIKIYVAGVSSFALAGLAAWAEWPLLIVLALSVAGCLGYGALLFRAREFEAIGLKRFPKAIFGSRGDGANA